MVPRSKTSWKGTTWREALCEKGTMDSRGVLPESGCEPRLALFGWDCRICLWVDKWHKRRSRWRTSIHSRLAKAGSDRLQKSVWCWWKCDHQVEKHAAASAIRCTSPKWCVQFLHDGTLFQGSSGQDGDLQRWPVHRCQKVHAQNATSVQIWASWYCILRHSLCLPSQEVRFIDQWMKELHIFCDLWWCGPLSVWRFMTCYDNTVQCFLVAIHFVQSSNNTSWKSVLCYFFWPARLLCCTSLRKQRITGLLAASMTRAEPL